MSYQTMMIGQQTTLSTGAVVAAYRVGDDRTLFRFQSAGSETAVALTDAVPIEEHADRPSESGVPVFWLHLCAIGPKPHDVGDALDLFAAHGTAIEEATSPERGVVATQPREQVIDHSAAPNNPSA